MSRVGQIQGQAFRERVHQPFYDTYVRGIGVSTVANNFRVFGNANIGDISRTNLQVAGQLAADATYVLKAIRGVMAFQGLADAEFTNAYGAIAALTNVVATNTRAHDLYFQMAYGFSWTLIVGNKPMINAPWWYIPAGGGPFGQSTENARHVITNGMPTQEAIAKLAKDIPISARQNFALQLESFPFARLGNGAAGVAINRDVSPLDMLNQFDGIKLVQVHIDGVITRDIQ